MPTVKGTIKSCRKNRKGFQLDNGEWYSRMDGEAMPILEEWKDNGVTIEVEYTEEGQWKNYTKDPTPVQEAPAATSNGGGTGFKKAGGGGRFSKGGAGGYKKQWHAYEDYEYQQSVNARIVRQNALNNAVSLVAGVNKEEVGPDTVDLVTTVAGLFVEWVEGGSN